MNDAEVDVTEELTPEREEALLALYEEEADKQNRRWGHNRLASEEARVRRARLKQLALERGSSVTLERSAEIIQSPPPPMLIEQWLPGAYAEGSGAVNVMYGPPGSGKTFCALDMALSVSTETHWQGHYPVHPGEDTDGIVWIAMESAAAVQWRYKAWCMAHGIDYRRPDFMLVRGFAGLHDAKSKPPRNIEGLYFLLEDMNFKPSLIVIDTLQAAMAGLDENSVEDMGAVMRALRELSDALSCTTLLVHHTGKTGASERGSSYLRGATDGMVCVGNGAIKVSRFKEALFDPDYALPFTLESVGDSAVFRTAQAGPQEKPEKVAADAFPPEPGTLRFVVLEAVRECDEDEQGASRTDIANYVNKAQGKDVNPMQVTNALTKLVNGGYIRREGVARNVRYYAL